MSIAYCIITIIAAIITIALITELFKQSSLPFGVVGVVNEQFVPYNNEMVREGRPVGAVRDDETIKTIFSQIVDNNRTKFGSKTFTNFKETAVFEQESKGVIDYVLSQINSLGNRNFKLLDTQSVKKEQTLDPEDRIVVTRWNVNMFIQEKNVNNVHSWSTNINFVLVQKDETLQITELHTITDFFYDKPLIDGINPNDKHYKLMNPLHLNKPWKTSGIVGDGREVLMADEESQALLNNWHKDLNTPQYACFADNGDIKPTFADEKPGFYEQAGNLYKSQKTCETQNGKWDKAVVSDAECPYFQANKNFPNKLGGVKLGGGTWATTDSPSGRCEMPINTKTIGYRFTSPDPLHKPFCYNCKDGIDGPGTWGPCCDQQRDIELYPQLGGNPDFAYPGDELERYQNKDVLAQRGLNWQRLPTHTKNILNSNQRQPVFNAVVGPGPSK